jgi:AAA15 family ATPase/GTPase
MELDMLLEFRVQNYRSFRDENNLSLVAAGDKSLERTNTVETRSHGVPRAVRSAVVYGANASGKSNLVRALQLMRGVVMESASLQPSQLFNVQPFRLDEESARKPTLFEVTILIDGTRYQYGFEFTPERIRAEWLLVYQKQKPQRWFDRKAGERDGKDIYEFGSHLTGPKRIWQDATRPNALFLSTAIQLNSEILAPLYRWFTESLVVFLDGGQLSFDFSTQMLQMPGGGARIAALLRAADIAITAISAERKKGLVHSLKLQPGQGLTDSKIEENEVLFPKFKHTVGTVSAEFELADESQGTQKMFSLAGPLFDVLEKGRVLVVDELDRSLHPLLVRQIIETFQDPELNPRGAQLIFTTHDTAQLDNTLLRRDQIWLAEKPHRSQASELVPLSEFSPRKGEALERNYLSGRYGGVPILASRLFEGNSSGER